MGFSFAEAMMKILGITLLLTLFACSTFSQQPSPPASDKQSPAKAQQAEEKQTAQEEVVKLGVTLVQVDAVVTDKKGRYVRDLKPEDFEIYEDGRLQHITHFSYILTQPDATASVEQPKIAEKSGDRKTPLTPVPPVNLRPEQVRRTMALVVDDLSLSFESSYFVRQSLKKFVDEQMQPGDLVAIIRTGAGMGALQQFTGDKRLLYAAIERVRWNPSGNGGISPFAPIAATPEDRAANSMPGGASPPGGNSSGNRDSSQPAQGDAAINQFREEIFSVGTLGALNFIVRGLRDLPGRKSVILFSDGFTIFSPNNDNNYRVIDAVRRLTDLANRASVVIYTLDARGLQYLGPTAADDFSELSREQIEQQLQQRRDNFFDSQQGLIYLAQQTGGFAIRNSNDLSRGVRRVLEDQKGYYLIGYTPDNTTFKPQNGRRLFHKINVKVKPAGLSVRSRSGFYGIADEDIHPAPRTREQQLITAITSPFASGAIPLRLTSVFGYEQKAGPYVVSLLHVDLNHVSFTDEEGKKKAVVDFGAVTFNDKGQVVDEIWRRQQIRIAADKFAESIKGGLLYTISVPVKKAGAYQLRAVVRDDATEQVGSANQFIEVPDVKKGRLTLSGITMQGVSRTANPSEGQSAVVQQEGAQATKSEIETNASPALRKLSNGMLMNYGFMIYNAKTDKENPLPHLEARVRILKEGKVVYNGSDHSVPVDASQDLKRLIAGGQISLTNMETGEYVLQVIVTDKLAKEKYNTSTQWIDFEIIK
jgi:VWFA-related protein